MQQLDRVWSGEHVEFKVPPRPQSHAEHYGVGRSVGGPKWKRH